ncbi:MAG: M15 family metallopeptidase, partial [Longimicrobiaceae bacterium]
VWVLDQGYVARQSGHNRGNTVDLTVVRGGRELDMGTPFDTFSEAAHTANAAGAVLENRMILKRAMEAEGFQNYDREWWHYRLPAADTPLDAPLSCFR